VPCQATFALLTIGTLGRLHSDRLTMPPPGIAVWDERAR
jgi:hypothetical protein